MNDPALEALLAEARAQFAGGLPARLGELEALVARGAWGDARRIAHRLRGSCGTYGFSRLSVVAGEVEDLLLAADTPDDAARATIAAHVAEMAREAGSSAEHG